MSASPPSPLPPGPGLPSPRPLAATGVTGLDDVLGGGFVRDRLYLVEGSPGSGKTTLAVQFLREGVRAGEACLYVTLAETAEELAANAASHGWDLDGIEVFELVPPESLLDSDQQQSLLYSSDLELGETTRLVLEAIERHRPARVVVDSLSEIRLLAQGSLRYRRQILALKHYFARHRTTVLLLDDMTAAPDDRTVHSVAHGVVQLEQLAPLYGAERRRLRVTKYRGHRYRGGYHDCTIATGGVCVFPRLVALEHHRGFVRDSVPSGVEGLDLLLGGGVQRGTATLLIGPAGTGKSLMGLHFIREAARRGQKSALFVFDEEPGLLLTRAAALGLDLAGMRDAGLLAIEPVDAAELSPGEFAHKVRATVEIWGAGLVMIDSLNGYQAAMPEEQFLVLHMHELLTYLNRRGVATLLALAQHGIVGEMRSPVDVTYLADTVVLLRYFEATGRVRRAASVVKKRGGAHEDTIREMVIDARGLRLGEPLRQFQGVLRGVPMLAGPGPGQVGQERSGATP